MTRKTKILLITIILSFILALVLGENENAVGFFGLIFFGSIIYAITLLFKNYIYKKIFKNYYSEESIKKRKELKLFRKQEAEKQKKLSAEKKKVLLRKKLKEEKELLPTKLKEEKAQKKSWIQRSVEKHVKWQKEVQQKIAEDKKKLQEEKKRKEEKLIAEQKEEKKRKEEKLIAEQKLKQMQRILTPIEKREQENKKNNQLRKKKEEEEKLRVIDEIYLDIKSIPKLDSSTFNYIKNHYSLDELIQNLREKKKIQGVGPVLSDAILRVIKKKSTDLF